MRTGAHLHCVHSSGGSLPSGSRTLFSRGHTCLYYAAAVTVVHIASFLANFIVQKQTSSIMLFAVYGGIELLSL